MKKALYLIAAMLMLFCSCTKEIEYTGGYEGEKLVLFSCANPDTILTAAVYKSVFIYSRSQDNCEQGLSGAKVTAIVNGKDTYAFREVKTVYDKESEDYWMHGGRDYDVEYVSDYTPKPGDHIVVKASCTGMKEVQGETTVPERPSVRLNKVSTEQNPDVNGLWQSVKMSVTINDPAEETNYYRMNVAGTGRFGVMGEFHYYDEWHSLYSNDILFYDTSIGGILDSIGGESAMVPEFFDDGSFNGLSRTFEVWFQKYYDPENDSPFRLTVDNASESLYRYSRSIDAYNGNGGIAGIFGELVIIYSNVENGLGCVGAISGTEVSFQP